MCLGAPLSKEEIEAATSSFNKMVADEEQVCIEASSPKPVTIQKRTDGTYRVKVGCRTFAFDFWCDVASHVCEYLDNPGGVEARVRAQESTP